MVQCLRMFMLRLLLVKVPMIRQCLVLKGMMITFLLLKLLVTW